jgi:hypothetical protein
VASRSASARPAAAGPPAAGVRRVDEAQLTYDQIILSQINYCSKAVGVAYNACVSNLVSMLPLSLREEVNKRFITLYRAIKGIACPEESEEHLIRRREAPSIVGKIALEHPTLFHRYGSTLPSLIYSLCTWEARVRGIATGVYRLWFAIVLEVLEEAGFIGLKGSQVFIGVPNVPREPDK